jgi:hypothetical protein
MGIETVKAVHVAVLNLFIIVVCYAVFENKSHSLVALSIRTTDSRIAFLGVASSLGRRSLSWSYADTALFHGNGRSVGSPTGAEATCTNSLARKINPSNIFSEIAI